MDELQKHLLQLIKETCCHPRGSKERQKGLNEIIWRIQQSGKLLKGVGVPDGEDALQQTWLYFCRNLCEATTAQHCYDAQQASVITWLNSYLKYRLNDRRKEELQENSQRVKHLIDENGEVLDPVDLIPAPSEPPLFLKDIREWLVNEGSQLRCIHLRSRPDINCQVLIERRLPPETPWFVLAQEFGVDISTLSNFYQRQCFPRLVNFGKSQGFL